MSWIGIVKCPGLPLSLRSIMLQKVSVLGKQGQCGVHSNKGKNMKTSPNDELETLLIQWFQQM
jgi:hypothetical protein